VQDCSLPAKEVIEAIKVSIRVFMEELCERNLRGRRIRKSL
jgi:hypothetical protein